MSRSCFPRFFLLHVFSAFALVAACSVDANVGSSDTSPFDAGADANLQSDAPVDASADAHDGAAGEDGTGGSDGSGNDSSGARDALTDGTGPIVDGGCGIARAQEGAWIDVVVVQQVLPQGAGGPITPGDYVLTGIRSYLSGPQGTAQFRETLTITGSTSVGAFESLTEIRNTTGDFTSQPETGETATYQADSPTQALFTMSTCPSKGTVGGSYTATATSFSVMGGTRPMVREFTRVR